MNRILLDFVEECAGVEADPDTVNTMFTPEVFHHYRTAMHLLFTGCVDTLAGPVYKLPIINEYQSDWLSLCAKSYEFSPNEEEGQDYRIEEAVLEYVDKELYDDLVRVLLPVLNAWCLMIQSRPITRVESLQIAKYRPEGTAGTGWHHDKTSDFTCVISLNPEGFEGGGTGVRTSPASWEEIAPLPKGWGLVFNGKTTQHRGLPVTSGERLLLVCWCSTEDRK